MYYMENRNVVDEKVLKQREANRRSYEKNKVVILAKRAAISEERKAAKKQYQKEWREKNRERLLEYDRARWSARGEQHNEQARIKRKLTPKREQSRKDASAYYKKRYGLTLEEFEARLVEQDGRCAICRIPQGERRLHVDHDHTCCPNKHGRICGTCSRGLLCGTCNMIIGLIEADPKICEKFQKYLNKWRPNGNHR